MKGGTQLLWICAEVVLLSVFVSRVHGEDCSSSSDWSSWSACSPQCGTSALQQSQRCECSGLDWPCRGSVKHRSRQCAEGNLGCMNNGAPISTNACTCPTGYEGTCCMTRWQCPIPSGPQYGLVGGNSYFYGDVITFSCDVNYQLMGVSSVTCESNRLWDGTFPTCSFVCPCQNAGSCSPASNNYVCSCARGYHGSLCETPVECGVTPNAEYGWYTPIFISATYGEVATLNCQPDYAPTGGDGSGTIFCDGSSAFPGIGVWSTPRPECAYVKSCRSNPCQSGGTCTNRPNTFSCSCRPGWIGAECNRPDDEPPVIVSCPTGIYVNATKPTAYVEWAKPEIVDLYDTPMTESSNYPQNSHTFQWGAHDVYYSKTKTLNSMTTTCSFKVHVYPTPCEPFPAPPGGAIACNGWNREYGAICGVFCEGNRAPGPGVEITQLMVCGANAFWSPPYKPFSCSGNRKLSINKVEYSRHFYSGICPASEALTSIQNGYINALKASSFRQMCDMWGNACAPKNVQVVCG